MFGRADVLDPEQDNLIFGDIVIVSRQSSRYRFLISISFSFVEREKENNATIHWLDGILDKN